MEHPRVQPGEGREARYAKGLWVSGDFFHVLQMQPELGRLLTKSDDYKGCGVQGAVISDGFWQREFGGRVDAIGKTLSLNAQPFQIIGVTPASFSLLEPGFNFDVAVPSYSEPAARRPAVYRRRDDVVAGGDREIEAGMDGGTSAAQLNTVAPGIFAATLPADRFARSVSHLLRAVENLPRRFESPPCFLL